MVLLGSAGLLPDIIKNIGRADWCGSLPYKWSHSKKKLVVKPPARLNIYKIRLLYSCIYVATAVGQVVLSRKRSSLFVTTHSVMFIANLLMTLVTHLVNLVYLPSIIALFNEFLNFEKRRSTEEPKVEIKKDKQQIIVKLTMFSLSMTGIFPPFPYQLDALRNPCFPLLVGYFLNSQCQADKLGVPFCATWTVKEVATKIILVLFSYAAWSFLLAGFMLHVGIQLVLHGHCFRVYIHNFEKSLTDCCDIKNISSVKVSAYRELQLLSTEYRACFSKVMLAVVTSGFLVTGTVSLYNTIQFASGNESAGGSLQYNIIYMWAGIASLGDTVFINGILADTYKTSSSVLNNLKTQVQLKKSKWFQRWLKSCPVIKVYFGGTNYYDELTPLNLLDFVIDQTVSLLLLKN